MNVWYHLSTIINRRRVSRFVMYASVIVAFITMQFFAYVADAAPSTDRTITFQGRLLSSAGAIVTDGNYNLQFKIYEGGSGTAANNPDGELKWTETYVNNNTNGGVPVKNGFFSVRLGSVNPFGSTIDWSADNLFLSMNIAGSSASCSSFGGAGCVADGEMLPMKQISAVPYAISAGSLNGKTASDFLQFGQGVQVDASNNSNSIYINKTGTDGNFMQLQNAGTDVFSISNTGSLTLGNATSQSISVATSDAGTNGQQLSLRAGAGGSGSGSTGGTLVLQGGAAGGLNGSGGDIAIDAGAKTGTGNDGSITIGTSHASSITIGNTTSSTTINGNLSVSSLDAKNGQSLNIGSTNATSINLNQDVTVASGKNFTVQGNAYINSAVNNTTAFQIQNSSSASVLNVSTSSGNILTLGSGNGGKGYVSHVSHGAVASSNVTSQTSSFNQAIPAGRTLIGSLTVDYSASRTNPTVTDSKGNTYTVDAAASHPSAANQYIFSSRITTPLSTGDTITMQFANSAVRWAWNVEQFDNIASVSRVDATASNSGISATLSSGTTAATTDSHELVFAGYGLTNPTSIITKQSGAQSSPIQGTSAGSSDRGNFVQWKYVDQTGTQEMTATSNTSVTWAGAVATYRTTGAMGLAGSIGFSDANGHTGSLNVSSLSADRVYTLPDEDGTLCIQGSANCGFIQSQTAGDQAASFRIGGTGTISNSSTSAFQVQNSSGVRQLNVNTVNNRVSIGTSDTTGTLLVLDTKTDAGDPAGTNGAMYYNSSAAKFRCYENGAWKDCITPLPVSATAATDTSNSTTTATDVNGLSFNLAANTKYYYKFVIQHQSAAASTGIGFGVTGPTSPISSNWCVSTNGTLSSNTAGQWGSYCGTNDASSTTTGVQTAGANYTSTMEGYIQTSTNAGDLKLRMKSSANAQTTVKQGSFGILQVVQ